MASSSQNRPSTATRGGQGTTSTPANNGLTAFFGQSKTTAPQDPGSPNAHRSSSIDQGQRRSSQEGNTFGNLHALKRASNDAGTQQRKLSLSDQTAKPGILGGMWNSFTKGQ